MATATATAKSPSQLLSKLPSSRSVSHPLRTKQIGSHLREVASMGRGPRGFSVLRLGLQHRRQEMKKSTHELQTLTTWLLKQEQAGIIDAELTIVLSSISMACKQIASFVQRAGISNLAGVQCTVNVQGKDQKKLDVVSNKVFSDCLRSSGRTGIIASEEEDVPVAVEESYSGNHIVVFDRPSMDLPTSMLNWIYLQNLQSKRRVSC